ncbi:MAG: signal recognition particle-docking protein FtsY [Gemmatimonadales bacterium]
MTSRLSSEKLGLWARLRRLALTDVNALMRGMNQADLEAMERLLLEADFGVPATLDLVQALEEDVRRGKLRTERDLYEAIEASLVGMLEGPPDPSWIAQSSSGPSVVLIAGVNGVGKTTTAAKLADRLRREGRSVLLAAADTWRAGAIAQLETWADRIGVPCVSGAPGGDPAAVAFDAVEAAVTRGADTVIVDTAGRLHTQEGLMDELRKVVRVVGRRAPGAPHESLLVLDGTVGQNALQQGREFTRAAQLSGLVVTKLDGTARGGSVVALRRELGIPIRFLGTGEDIRDLEPFDAKAFVDRLLEE